MCQKKNKMESNAQPKKKLILSVFIILLAVIIVQTFIIINIVSSNRNQELKSNGEIVINADSIIETPYVDIVYHTEAVDSLKVKVDSDGQNSVTFLASVEDVKDIDLFTFYFDDTTNGDVIGVVKNKDQKKVEVSVVKNEFDESIGLNASDISRLLSTQETLLDTIISNMEFE